MYELTVAGTLGLAEKIMSGKVRKIATATDKAERFLNERIFEGLAVVIGWMDPLREEYKNSVDDEVNVKAVVAIIISQIHLKESGTERTNSLPDGTHPQPT